MRKLALLALVALLLSAERAPTRVRAVWAQTPPEPGCSVVSQNLFVRDVLQEIYLWYRDLPDPDPARFDSPEAYLEAVRYQPLDSNFSYIASRQADEAFFSDSQFIGFGFSMWLLGTDLYVTQVFPDSPASEAGFMRGVRLLEINGRTIQQLVASGSSPPSSGPTRSACRRRSNFAISRDSVSA